ncbi:MAG: BMP family ABC transporter substrate-binding protein, partial [Clostridiaceae bacterium]|nr:BMP family ABC transporter substrate-binding protein [Clostridiaceae bacterium]
MRKRVLTFLLAIVMGVAFLAGCSNDKDGDPKPTATADPSEND